MEHRKILNNIDLYVHNTDKFKDLTLEVRFIQKIDHKNATVRSLLALMMQDRSFKYDTKQKMNKALDELYGASFNISCNGFGYGAMIKFSIRTIDQRFADFNLLEEQFDFIKEIILNPLLDEKVFNEAKQALNNELLRNEDDPKEYANKQALALAGDDYPLGIDISGDINLLKTIKLADVKNEYLNMLKKDHIYVGIVGQITIEQAEQLCQKYLIDLNSTDRFNYHYQFSIGTSKKRIIERNIEQSILTLIYNTSITIDDDRYWSLKIATAMLGQLPNSLLFTEVREKKSLCYSIYSSLISFDSIMLISTGINYENTELAQELIVEQIKTIEDDKFSDFLFHSAKQMLINSYKSINDNPQAYINFSFMNHLIGSVTKPEDIIEKIKTINRSDINQVFKTLKLNTTFILKGKDDKDAEDI
ncbi:MAG: pitrilysin family protein [Erysipelotrichaceae bacterium]|nr:pitrilysin family protein [Erysipelotrichaceae bacterium]MDD4642146.1 pitrilysin family protein [Erysipelotrichaceae bacterium]